MSLGWLRLALSHVTTRRCCSKSPFTVLLLYKAQCNRTTWGNFGIKLQQCTLFSTILEDGGESTESASKPQEQKKKKKQDSKARVTISSVGRKINQRHLLLLNEQGENMGTMHRAEVLRMIDEKGLKLVSVNEHADPPVYQLMSGKQIHEEQMKLREKQKAKTTGPTQVKDLTLSSDIALHDLDTKLKQVANWLEKKHHVRLTLKARRYGNEQTLDRVLDEMVAKVPVQFGFVSKPKLIREGQAASCFIRPPSAKELQQQGARKSAESPPTNLKQDSEHPDTENTSTKPD